MTVIAKLSLLETAAGVKCLCGHADVVIDGNDETVLVLRKMSDTTYALHALAVDDSAQALRAILCESQASDHELQRAILSTTATKTRKRKSR